MIFPSILPCLYTHYRLTLPNDQVRLKLSGNYRLTVYDDADGKDKPAFTTCFRVLQKEVNVSAQVSSDTEIDRNKTHTSR
ncbi:MAG: type IX secretion system plug protein domain-containing protein [Bacteroides cellulosilyticus]